MNLKQTIVLSMLAALALNGSIGEKSNGLKQVEFTDLLDAIENRKFGERVEVDAFVGYTGVNFKIYKSSEDFFDNRDWIPLGFEVDEELTFDKIINVLGEPPKKYKIQGYLDDLSEISMGHLFRATFLRACEHE